MQEPLSLCLSQAGDVPQPETPEAPSHPGQDFPPPHPEGMVGEGVVLTGEQQKAPRRERGLEKKETADHIQPSPDCPRQMLFVRTRSFQKQSLYPSIF